MLTFKANNPTWVPPPEGEAMFGQLSEFINNNANANAEVPRAMSTVNNFLQDSSPNIMSQVLKFLFMLRYVLILSQSMGMLSPMSSMYGGLAGQSTATPDPKALAFLHRVHQRFQEMKTQRPSPVVE